MAVLSAANAAVNASEVPDVRGARFLPDKAFVGGITVTPGPHTVTVTFSDGSTQHFNVNAKVGGLNIVEAVNLGELKVK
jgi:hypothetical protein